MNKLEQVTQILYTATDYADALAKLAAINANVTTYQSYSVIDEFGLIFFASRNYQLPLVITFDGVSPSVTVEHYQAVYAQQQLELSKSVPAHDSPAAVEHLVIPEQSTESVDNLKKLLHGFRIDIFRAVLRTERRLRNSRVKGLSS